MSLGRLLFGRPLQTSDEGAERVSVWRGLAVMSSDAISSVAYAADEIFAVLAASGVALAWGLPIAAIIVLMLGTFLVGYLRVIATHPQGGGSFTVTRENLGAVPGLVAGAALMTDYVLTVAVSLTAGVENLAAALPSLEPYRVVLALLFLVVLTLGNLRGIREAGALFALPTYGFILSAYLTLGVGFYRLANHTAFPLPRATATAAAHAGVTALGAITLWVFLRAFANGSTALTGIEAVANGVPAFRPPEVKSAQKTQALMCLILASLFLPTVLLGIRLGVHPGAGRTVLVDVSRAAFGGGPLFLLLPVFTLAILLMAGNTSFSDFPRVASWLAYYGYAPRPLRNRGDRLVFNNGIWFLAAAVAALIVAFQGSTAALIPLYSLGVYTAICLSQTSMTLRWWRERGPRWAVNAAVNGGGALLAGVVLLVVAVTKFTAGAWAILLLIPLLVAAMLVIRRHYDQVARATAIPADPVAAQAARQSQERWSAPLSVVPVADAGLPTARALALASAISQEVQAVYVAVDPTATAAVQAAWVQHFPGRHLEVLASPYRTVAPPLVRHIRRLVRASAGRPIIVVLPEIVPSRWWQNFLHNQTALFLKGAFLHERGVMVLDVPYQLDR